MTISRRTILSAAAAATAFGAARARAQKRPLLRVGVLTDLSGTYHDATGQTSVACAEQAVADFDPAAHGFDVEVLASDHQNKPDVAASIVRQWFDQGVLAAIDVPTSSVALAVAQIARDKDRIMLNASATTTALTDGQCSPNTIVWSFDTYMLARSQGGATVRAGGKKWFFITADYAFGHILEEQTADLVLKAGGEVKGRVRYPFPDTNDFSAYLQQAQASGADVLGLANAGLDSATCIKQAHEFGLNTTMRICPLLIFIPDIRALGPMAVGLNVTETFYWDMNERTRRFAQKIAARTSGKRPDQAQASSYAITLHWLKAVAALGPNAATRSGREVVARMKAMPTDDDAFGEGRVRADGRGEFPAYLFEVKAPSKPDGWDLYRLLSTTPAAEATHPLNPKCTFAAT
jgi:branched-chain amino acid transport system substrate-binding protein